jgi:type III secretion protein V
MRAEAFAISSIAGGTSMMATLSRGLLALSGRGDLVVALIVILGIVMMIIPLPTVVVDVLIASNIAVSFLILLVSLYISGPPDFSTMPSVILVATVFRLAISITTSRLVLLQADAGELVAAFGNFVIGGNIGVGLVIFLIITVAQFVVITKGSERVAEVAARFSLDAMPGKQMSIDSDLRSGDIDQAEARRLRLRLQLESQFYGAMDGTMKFVKGDAMAGLLIVMVNLVGGLAVGVLQRGLPFGEAIETFSMLTVGDGLVAQIPALLISVAAGTVVTRVGAGAGRDLGNDITAQILAEPRALLLASFIMAALAVIPGFPAPVFLVLAVAFAGGYWVKRRAGTAGSGSSLAGSAAPAAAAEPQKLGAESQSPRALDCVVVRVGRDLGGVLAGDEFSDRASRARRELVDSLGVEARPIELRIDATIGADHFRVDLEDVPVSEGAIPHDCVLVDDERINLELLGVTFREGPPLLSRRRALWIEARHRAVLAEAGVEVVTPMEALGECLALTLRRHATHFIGIQETRRLIAKIEPNYGDLVKELQKSTPLPKISEILRRLVQEEVPIRNLRLILEALIEWGQREQDVVLLVEYVRVALRREICFRWADANKVITAYLLERAVEETVRASVRKTSAGTFLALPDQTAHSIVEQVRTALEGLSPKPQPVVLATMDIRRHVRNLLSNNHIDIPVISYQEISQEFNTLPLATIMLQLPAAAAAQSDLSTAQLVDRDDTGAARNP